MYIACLPPKKNHLIAHGLDRSLDKLLESNFITWTTLEVVNAQLSFRPKVRQKKKKKGPKDRLSSGLLKSLDFKRQRSIVGEISDIEGTEGITRKKRNSTNLFMGVEPSACLAVN